MTLLLVLFAAVLLRQLVPANTDVSWMLTIAEKMLDGQRLYVDLVELNAPGAVFPYLAAVALSRGAGPAPELAVDAMVFLLACTSLWIAGRALAITRLLDGHDGWTLAILALAVLTILPAQAFGQREHLALIAAVPALAVSIARGAKASPAPGILMAAGIGAGIMIMIKPHFAIPAAASLLAAAVYAGSWRPLVALENWIAAAAVVLYGFAVVLAFPAFLTEIAPLSLAVYVPMRASLPELLTGPAMLLWATVLLALISVKRHAILAPPFAILVAASLGFGLAFLLQGKGWPYQAYPMLALVFLATAWAAAERPAGVADRPAAGRTRVQRLAGGAAPAVLFAASFALLNHTWDTRALADTLRQMKPHPSMLALSSDLAVGHPLVRQVGGTWAGRVCSQWITVGALTRLWNEKNLSDATVARLRAYEAWDRAMLADAIRHGRPDVILVDNRGFDWLAWADADPMLAAEFKRYRAAQTIGDILLLRREAH